MDTDGEAEEVGDVLVAGFAAVVSLDTMEEGT